MNLSYGRLCASLATLLLLGCSGRQGLDVSVGDARTAAESMTVALQQAAELAAAGEVDKARESWREANRAFQSDLSGGLGAAHGRQSIELEYLLGRMRHEVDVRGDCHAVAAEIEAALWEAVDRLPDPDLPTMDSLDLEAPLAAAPALDGP